MKPMDSKAFIILVVIVFPSIEMALYLVDLSLPQIDLDLLFSFLSPSLLILAIIISIKYVQFHRRNAEKYFAKSEVEEAINDYHFQNNSFYVIAPLSFFALILYPIVYISPAQLLSSLQPIPPIVTLTIGIITAEAPELMLVTISLAAIKYSLQHAKDDFDFQLVRAYLGANKNRERLQPSSISKGTSSTTLWRL